MSTRFCAVRISVLLCCLGFCLMLSPAGSGAIEVGAGWTHADVGLHDNGDGFYLGVGNRFGGFHEIFDASYELQYVQKRGSQPTPFFDPVGGFLNEDAEVTLHVVQPSVSFGARMPGLPFVPRLYVGGAIGLKVSESWSDFPGVPDVAYGYKETDAILHAGVSVTVGSALLDVRWSQSAVGQLLFDNQERPLGAAKAAPPEDLRVPTEGFKTEAWQVGVGYSF